MTKSLIMQWLHLFLLILLCNCPGFFIAQPDFLFKSLELGLNDTTRSWGVSWGDIDGNTFPDLYVSAYYKEVYPIDPSTHLPPRIYLNEGPSGYEALFLNRLNQNDFHSGAFFKFEDNDEWDLLAITGGASDNLLFTDPLDDFSSPMRFCGPCRGIGRGRNAGLLDYNNDGRIDVVMHHAVANATHPLHLKSLVFLQSADHRFEIGYRHILANSQRGGVADVDGDGLSEYVAFSSDSLFVYRYDESGFTELFSEKGAYSDADFGDYDNDGDFELILTRSSKKEAYSQLTENHIEFYLRDFPIQKEVEFLSEGDFELFIRTNRDEMVLTVGADGVVKDKFLPQSVSINDNDFLGWSNGPFGESYAHLGFDELSQTWKLTMNSDLGTQSWVSITSEGTSLQLGTLTNISPPATNEPPISLHSFEYEDDQLVLNKLYNIDTGNVASVTSADFDNDGDLDIVVSKSNVLTKEPYRIYLNNGQAVFTRFDSLEESLAGAEVGFADAVTVGDYNLDGKMDIVGVNGWADERGMVELFENVSPDKEWVEFILHGVQSNSMAIGTIVTVYHDGGLQRTLIDGGLHNRAQDEQRIHFGLGMTSVVDSLVVKWPSGIVTRSTGLPSGQRYSIYESNSEDLDGDGIPNMEDNCPEYFNPQEQGVVYVDEDGDGFTACMLDCDEDNENVFPGAEEICDGLDNDCDGIIDNGCIGCESYFTPPQDLSKSFDPVSGIVDRVQLKWYKESPVIRYSDVDAAACDIKFWEKRNLNPETGEAIGPVIHNPDTVSLIDRKKFMSDGITPRSIFKWPVKFYMEGADNSKRALPNKRYEWKVRCACEHGSGLESPWSEIKIFNTPNFNTTTGAMKLETIAQGGSNSMQTFPNPATSERVTVRLSQITDGPMLVIVQDLHGRVVYEDIRKGQELFQVDLSHSELTKGAYLLKIIQAHHTHHATLLLE